MKSNLLAIAAIAGATLVLGAVPSRAEVEGPWCATVFNGEGSVKEICHFKDFASCQAEVISGNRGQCGNNPRYLAKHDPRWSTAYQAGQPVQRKAKRKHRHTRR